MAIHGGKDDNLPVIRDDASEQEETDYDPDTNQQAQAINKEKDRLELAKTEDKCVWYLRLATACVLLAVATTVCLGVYFEGRQSENDDFEQDFLDLSIKLVSSFEDVVQQRFGVIQTFGQDLTAQANGTWPFVTPPYYAHRVNSVARLSQAMLLVLLPQVNRDQVPAWDQYANQNNGWREQSVSVTMGIPIEEVQLPPFLPTIMNTQGPDGPVPAITTGDGPYFPFWTAYPSLVSAAANTDFRADVEHRGPMDHTVVTGEPTFESISDCLGVNADDNRCGLFRSNPFVDFQSDAFTVAFFPGTCLICLVVCFYGSMCIFRLDSQQNYVYRSLTQSLIALKRIKRSVPCSLLSFTGEPISMASCLLEPTESW